MAHQATLDAILHIQIFPSLEQVSRRPHRLTHFGLFSPGSNSGVGVQREDAHTVRPSFISSHGCCIFFLLSMSSRNARKMAYASGKNLITDGFYPVLLSNVHSAAPHLPLDPVVFRSLLLCILASGGKNILLRSYDEDVSLVQSITALVSVGSCFRPPAPRESARTPRINATDRLGIHLLIIINLDSIEGVWVPDAEGQN